MLKLSPLKRRVIVVSDEKANGEDLFGKLKAFKMKMRESTYFDFCDIELQIHASDNQTEAKHLSKVFLSPNNLQTIKHRLKNTYRKELIDNIVAIKKKTMEAGVSTDDIMVVNGMVLDVLGIRESHNDLDIICMPSEREKLIEGGFDISALYYYGQDMHKYIWDDNRYFIFNGLKFLNLEYVKQKKIFEKREKDIKDLRLIELYEEMIRVYDEKAALKQGILEEVVRRRIN